MPERFSPAHPNYLRFVSTPTIDIEPIFMKVYKWLGEGLIRFGKVGVDTVG